MSSVEFYGELDRPRFCALARSVAGTIKKGTSVALVGDLGVGKTTFCAEVIGHLSEEEFLGSPTFVILNSYKCAGFSLHHVDLYRIASEAELSEVGIFDIANVDDVLLIEWPEILKGKVLFDTVITIKDTEGTEGRMRDVIIEKRPF